MIDEPLYGHFLRVTGTVHPGGDEVLATVNTDGNAVMTELLDESAEVDILFMKQMAHHLVDVDESFLQQTNNIFLIRDPREMLPSLTIQLPHAGLADTGLKTQWQLFERLQASGQQPAVLDSKELLLNPRLVLSRLCKHLDIAFVDAMLAWKPGARPEDGIWAKHWYHAVHKSSGFSPYVRKQGFPDALGNLLAECKPWYDKLYAQAIRSDSGA